MLLLKIFGKVALGLISFFAFGAIIRSVWFLQMSEAIWLAFLGFWFIALFTLEVLWLCRKQKLFPRLLTHLRFAPLAVSSTFIIAIVVTTLLFSDVAKHRDLSYFDSINVQNSKYKIRAYIYGNTSPEQDVTLYLYNDDAGGCLNGMVAREAELYTETAREGLSSSNAAIRARSLRASIEVYDSFNGGDFSFLKTVERMTQDEDLLIRQIATKFLNDIKPVK